MKQEILSLEVIAALRADAPEVTVPSFEATKAILKALTMFAAGNTSQKDAKGKVYWRCGLDELLALVDSAIFTPKLVGNVCRSMQLVMKRENDGFKVAWSQGQLDILNKNIK